MHFYTRYEAYRQNRSFQVEVKSVQDKIVQRKETTIAAEVAVVIT